MSTQYNQEIDAKPTHHVHSENEPLPGAKGGSATVDYSADTLNRIADQDPHPSEHSDTASTVTDTDNKPLPDKLPASQGGTYPAETRQGAGRFEGEPAPTTSGDTSEDVPVAVNTDNKPLSNEPPASQGGTHQGAGCFKSEPAPTTGGDLVTDTDKPLPKKLPSSQSGTYPAETRQSAGRFEGKPAPTTSGDASEDVPVAVNTDNKPLPNEPPVSQGGTYPAETRQGVGRFEGEPAPATSGGTSEDVPVALTLTDNKPLPKKLPSSQSGTYPAETHQGAGRFEGEPAPTTSSDTSELPDSAKKASISDKIVGKTEKASLFVALSCRNPASYVSLSL